MSDMLIIIDDPVPTPVSAFHDGPPIATKLTMELARKIVKESSNWPLPWEDAWKQMYVQGKVEPRRVVKQRKGGKK